MAGDDDFRLEHLDGPQGILRPHGEVVADGDHCQVNPLFSDERHPGEKSGVTGEIDLFVTRGGDQETTRHPAIRPIWEG